MDTTLAAFWANFNKLLKDGVRGAMLGFLPLIMNGVTGTAAWIDVAGGVFTGLVGIVAGALRGAKPGLSDKLKIINDFVYGVLMASQSVIQEGLTDHQKLFYILGGIGIASLGVIANVLHDDYADATGVMKIVKDLMITIVGILQPALSAGLSAGTGFLVILAGCSHALFSGISNVLEADWFGLTGQDPSTVPASPSDGAAKPVVVGARP